MGKNVRKNLAALTKKIAGPMSQQTVTEVLIIGGMYADLLTPIDTGNLLRSRFREITRGGDGAWRGKYGYTARYAAAVHGFSGKLKGKPRENFGKSGFGGGTGVGNYWDPDAEPEFLTKGFERDGLDAIKKAILKGMSV